MKSEVQCSINKSDLRKQMIAKRKSLSEGNLNSNSAKIFEKFLSLNIDAKNVFCYLDFNNEVKTDAFISHFLKNAQISVPYCDGDIMKCAFYDKNTTLKPSKYGVLEPESPVFVNENEIEVCITPGVSFDKIGNRIGYGKGYYDKFFESKNIIKIGICHDFQLVESINTDIHDIKMNYIITEKRIIKL